MFLLNACHILNSSVDALLLKFIILVQASFDGRSKLRTFQDTMNIASHKIDESKISIIELQNLTIHG